MTTRDSQIPIGLPLAASLAALVIFLGSSCLAETEVEGEDFSVFPKNEEELNENWERVRPEESGVEFKEEVLRIQSLPGNIWGGGKAKNILLQAIEKENVCITATVSLEPDKHGEQAGLFLYLDDDNYFKVVKEWVGKLKAHTIVCAKEVAGKGEALKMLPLDSRTVDLRIVKVGKKVAGYVRGNEEELFTLLAHTELPEKAETPVQLALYSAGAKEGVAHWAEFSSLTVEPIEGDADVLGFLKP